MDHPPYVSRAQWGARPPDSTTPMRTPTDESYLHHTATAQHGARGMRSIQDFHMDTRNFRDIAYSWVFDNDGTVFQGRGWGVAHGANLGVTNAHSHSFCFMGNFEIEQPSKAALDSFIAMARYGIYKGYINTILLGHKDEPDEAKGTDCPGKYLYAKLPFLRVAIKSPVTPPTYPTPPTEDDEMEYIYDCDTKPALFFSSGTHQKLNEAKRNFLRSQGIVAKKVDVPTWEVIASFPEVS